MQRRDAEGATLAPRVVRLLGWFVAANAIATVSALLGAGSAAGDAAPQLALWCGVG